MASSKDAVVLDVREDDEWVHGHIEGATHIPMGDVPARLDELPEGDPLYGTCRGGGRSPPCGGTRPECPKVGMYAWVPARSPRRALAYLSGERTLQRGR